MPQNPIVQSASKAIEQFFLTAIADLETKMKDALQPQADTKPLNGLIAELTENMIRQLSDSVSKALGTTKSAGGTDGATGAGAMGATHAAGAAGVDSRAQQPRPTRRKPAPRRQQ